MGRTIRCKGHSEQLRTCEITYSIVLIPKGENVDEKPCETGLSVLGHFSVPAEWDLGIRESVPVTTIPDSDPDQKRYVLRHIIGVTSDPEKYRDKSIKVVAATIHQHVRTAKDDQRKIDTFRTVLELTDGELIEFTNPGAAKCLVWAVKVLGFPTAEKPMTLTVRWRIYKQGNPGWSLEP